METKNYIGEESINNEGYKMTIVGYKNKTNVDVMFYEPRETIVYGRSYYWFEHGSIRNPYHPRVYGKGTLGNKYPANDETGPTKEYQTWHSMLQRCFSDCEKTRHDTYQNVTCCDEWLCFENFYEWMHAEENYEKWKTIHRSGLDKDIIIKNNTIYSPETCCLVPPEVNTLFVKSDRIRGEYPIGVRKKPDKNKYEVQCKMSDGRKQKYLGAFDTVEEAFNVYKKYKESIIKSVAEENYANRNISYRCYQAMMDYQVEFDD